MLYAVHSHLWHATTVRSIRAAGLQGSLVCWGLLCMGDLRQAVLHGVVGLVACCAAMALWCCSKLLQCVGCCC